ncbi:17311_t:CDS:2, partial [Racocetra persica]
SYTVKIKRKRKEFMVPSWENYLGFSSKLENIPYYTSTLETFPLLNDPEFPTLTMLTKITIEPQTFIVQVETDKRTKTVLSSIGLIGGAWGSAATIYVILFGAIVIKPWGWIQKYGFKINKSVQTKLQSTFGFIPLVHHSKTNNLNNNELKKRLDSLQLFLTEYVVDVQYLEEIYKSNMNKK